MSLGRVAGDGRRHPVLDRPGALACHPHARLHHRCTVERGWPVDPASITIVQGLTMHDSGEDAEDTDDRLEDFVEEKFPEAELEIHEGNQPVYTYLVAVE